MDADTMLEAGVPLHWARYTGRTLDAIRKDLEPVERRLVFDEAMPGDAERYAALVAEFEAHPQTIDRVAAVRAWMESIR